MTLEERGGAPLTWAANLSFKLGKMLTTPYEDAKRKEQFSNLLAFARVTDNPAVFQDIVRVIGFRVLAGKLTKRFLAGREGSSDWGTNYDQLLGRHPPKLHYRVLDQCVDRLAGRWKVSLRDHLVIPWPWSSYRYLRALGTIGNRYGNPWAQDDNHKVRPLWPVGVVLVASGNHSIGAGVVHGEGSIDVTTMYDISKSYEHYRTDGVSVFSMTDNNERPLWRVSSFHLAALFELGRLRLEKGFPMSTVF